MKYLFALIGDQSRSAEATPEERRAGGQAWEGYTGTGIDAGVHLGGEGLQPPTTATTVKIQETGDHIVTDGPFAETKEQLGGYYLLDCKDHRSGTLIRSRGTRLPRSHNSEVAG